MNAYRGAAYHELDHPQPALKTMAMKNRLRVVLALVLASAVLALGGTAHAQGYGPGYYQGPPPPPPPGVLRSGMILGASLGFGGIFPADCDDCDGLGSFALQGHIGGMIAPQLAVMFDAGALFHPFEDDSLLTSSTFLGVLRGWLGRVIWLEAGLGLGYLQATDESGYFIVEERTGLAALIGAGIEVLQTPSFALDLQVRLSGARYSSEGDAFGITNLAVMIGFNFY